MQEINLTNDITMTYQIADGYANTFANDYTLTGDGFTLDGGYPAYSGLGPLLRAKNTGSGDVSITIGDGLSFTNFYNNGLNTASGGGNAQGGVVWLEPLSGGSAALNIGNNVTFSHNTAAGSVSSSGGAIYVNGNIAMGNGVTFEDNHATNTAMAGIFGGGAIFTTGNSLSAGDNATFRNNTSNAYYGGAISVNIQNNTTLGHTMSFGNDAVFEFNKQLGDYVSASFGGGAIMSFIYNSMPGGEPIRNSIGFGERALFSGNEGASGGAINQYLLLGIGVPTTLNTLSLASGAQFLNNYSRFNGGAVQQHSETQGTFELNNQNSITLGDNAVFTGNHADQDGGALSQYSIPQNPGAVLSLFNNNSVNIGAYAAFNGNYAGRYGGVFYQDGGAGTITNNVTLADGAAFTGNYAGNSGGVFYQNSVGTAISLDDDNTVIIGQGAIFTGNYANAISADPYQTTGGGVIYQNAIAGEAAQHSANIVDIGANSTFTNNYTNTDSALTINAGNGGTIFQAMLNNSLASDAENIINIGANTRFITDEERLDGGGLALATAKDGGVIYSRMNTTGGDGTHKATINIGDGVEFTGSSASNYGGAIYLQTNHIGIEEGDISGEINITTAGGVTRFSGNKDSFGANDIYMTGTADSVLSVNVNGHAGETIFEGGIANGDLAAASINKSNGGKLTFGENANNSRFNGTFNVTGGEAAFLGDFFLGAVTNVSDATLSLLKTAGTIDIFGPINLQGGATVNAVNNHISTINVASLDAQGVNNFAVDVDETGASDQFNIISGAGAGTLNVSGLNGVNFSNATAESLNLEVFTGDIAGYAFSAAPGLVLDTSAYEYELEANNANDGSYTMVRRASGGGGGDPVISNTGNTVSSVPMLHLAQVKVGMNELTKRLGELRDEGKNGAAGFWARGIAKHMEVTHNINTDMSLFGFELGADKQFTLDSSRLYAGIMGGYLSSNNIHIKQTGIFDGSGKSRSPSVGFYGTWIDDSGWFIDATARYFRVNMDLNNVSAAGQHITYDANRSFISGSVEGGKAVYISSFKLEPKLELQYVHGGADSHSTNVDNHMHYDSINSLQTRLRLQFMYLPQGEASALKPYVQAGVFREWMGESKVNFANVNLDSDLGGTGVEATLGLNARLSENAYLYGEAMYEHSSFFNAISGNLGVRLHF
jgi:outer membrane autotransporter protein